MPAEKRQKCPAHFYRSNSCLEVGVFEKMEKGKYLEPKDDRVLSALFSFTQRIPRKVAAQKLCKVRLMTVVEHSR